jgi:hypothetical protein
MTTATDEKILGERVFVKKLVKVERDIKSMDDEAIVYLLEFIIKEMERRDHRYEIEHKRIGKRNNRIRTTLSR